MFLHEGLGWDVVRLQVRIRARRGAVERADAADASRLVRVGSASARMATIAAVFTVRIRNVAYPLRETGGREAARRRRETPLSAPRSGLRGQRFCDAPTFASVTTTARITGGR
jgi:hypothetical protein